MSMFDQLGNNNNLPSALHSLVGDTLMDFGHKVINDFDLDDNASECVPALIELAAVSLVWILLSREEYTDDYIELLFKSVRSRTMAHITPDKAGSDTLEAGAPRFCDLSDITGGSDRRQPPQ